MPEITIKKDQHDCTNICMLAAVCLLFSSVILFSSANAFDPNATKYVFMKKWGSRGTGDGQFQCA